MKSLILDLKKLFVLLSLLFLSCSDSPKTLTNQELREKAHRAYSEERYKEALELYQEACEGNDGESCFLVSNLFNIAEEWKKHFYTSSCDLGYARGCMILGLYYSMRSNTQDIPQSLAYFSKSCDLGNEVACRIYKKGLK